MDRREAMLREMNLYPLWVRRDLPATMPEANLVEVPAVVAPAVECPAPQSVVTRHIEPQSAVPQEIVPPHENVAPQPVESRSSESQPAESKQDAASGAHASPEVPLPAVEAAPVDEADDLFSVTIRDDDDDWTGVTFREHEEGDDSLREFQDKVAAGPLADVDWPELREKVRDCEACSLRAGCTQTVFGVGDMQADWLFVGEGPGAEEDLQGEPFVGQAGKLLDNMLLSIGLKRGNNVFIANVVKCRPPGNRNPLPEEIAACLPYLRRQIELIQPKLIVAVGKVAATTLLGRDATLGSLRGKTHDYRGIPMIVTYHPAYLLRSPMEKAKAWQDLCRAVETMRGLGETE